MIVFLSILRGSNLIYSGILLNALPQLILISTPVGIVEGYRIHLTIRKTLSRMTSMKDLAYIYGIFLVAAVLEAGFINLLVAVT